MTHMDDKTNLTPEQDEVQTGEEVSFTISGEDAAAQEALNAKKTAKKKVQYWGTGRRKKAIARVRLIPGGEGAIVINKRDITEYFPQDTMKLIVRQPLVLTNTLDKYDVFVNVCGGGYTGQAGAIRHGIARALIVAEPELRSALKKEGYLTRDPRAKERKKYGLKKARKAPQFSKR